MIGIVIAGHGSWPSALRESLHMLYGDVPYLEVCQITDAQSPEQIREQMDEALSAMPNCSGYVFLLDIFGGSPCHAAASYALRDDIQAVTGANLAMLIELVSVRETAALDELGALLVKTGREGIKDLMAQLRRG